MVKMRRVLVLVGACVAVAVGPGAFAQTPAVGLGSAAGPQGSNVTVPVSLSANGAAVCSASYDIGFDNTKLSYVSVASGPAASGANKVASASLISPTTLRVLIAGLGPETMADGTMAFVTFNVLVSAVNTALSGPCDAVKCDSSGLSPTCTSATVTPVELTKFEAD